MCKTKYRSHSKGQKDLALLWHLRYITLLELFEMDLQRLFFPSDNLSFHFRTWVNQAVAFANNSFEQKEKE